MPEQRSTTECGVSRKSAFDQAQSFAALAKAESGHESVCCSGAPPESPTHEKFVNELEKSFALLPRTSVLRRRGGYRFCLRITPCLEEMQIFVDKPHNRR
jgi:hypothetical protein